MTQGINQSPRVRAALALGDFAAAQLGRMLWMHPNSVTRILQRLQHMGQAKIVRHERSAVGGPKRVWGLR